MHHLCNGWFFERVDEPPGSVRILKRDGAHPDAPIEVEITMMPEEWASIVAAVSTDGDTATSYQRALSLHNGEPYVC